MTIKASPQTMSEWAGIPPANAALWFRGSFQVVAQLNDADKIVPPHGRFGDGAFSQIGAKGQYSPPENQKKAVLSGRNGSTRVGIVS